MSSLKQIEANRHNALKSTGPTTPEGKERSRRNALRHGLTAETVVVTFEDIEDYQAFEAAVTADYNAETAVERELVLRLASVLWRLRRATGIEASLFEFATDGTFGVANFPEQISSLLDAQKQKSDSIGEDMRNQSTKSDIGAAFLRLTTLPTFPLDRLSRYELTLWRQARQIVLTLESLRRRVRSRNRLSFSSPFHPVGSE